MDNRETETLHYLLVGPHSSNYKSLTNLIAQTLQESGITAISEDITLGASWAEGIQRAIERADFIIADITGNNPNVMYEVGYAHALQKPVLPIVQVTEKGANVPSNMQGYLYMVYDPAKPEDLRRYIKSWSSRLLNRTKEIVVNE